MFTPSWRKQFSFEPDQLDLAKQAYRELQRLARCPLSMHEKSGSLCVPVAALDRKLHIPNLDDCKTLDPNLLSPIIKELKACEKLSSLKVSKNPKFPKNEGKRIRPCMIAALEKPLEGGAGHLMRLAVAREYLAAGYSVDEIVPLFQNQPDFKPEKTRYYVEHAAKNPTKPFKCQTIRELGFCINCKGG